MFCVTLASRGIGSQTIFLKYDSLLQPEGTYVFTFSFGTRRCKLGFRQCIQGSRIQSGVSDIKRLPRRSHAKRMTGQSSPGLAHHPSWSTNQPGPLRRCKTPLMTDHLSVKSKL